MAKRSLRRKRNLRTAGSKTIATIKRRLAVVLLLLAALFATLPGKLDSSIKASEPIQIDSKLLTSKEVKNSPVRIIIPKLDIDLPVVTAPVVGGYWQLSEDSASFGQGSAYPDESGNMVIFAHAREGLFLPLREIKNDQKVYVLSSDKWHRYKVTETKLVNPDQVEVISPTPDERLTLFTCSGFLDSKRLIVTAIPDMIN